MNYNVQLNRLLEASARTRVYIEAEDYASAFNELGFIEQVSSALRAKLPPAPKSITDAFLKQRDKHNPA